MEQMAKMEQMARAKFCRIEEERRLSGTEEPNYVFVMHDRILSQCFKQTNMPYQQPLPNHIQPQAQ